MPILSDEEIRRALVVSGGLADDVMPGEQLTLARYGAQPLYVVLAREIERLTAERVNPRIIVLRKRWLPVRVLRHYQNYRHFQTRRDALVMAWRTATS